MTQSVVKNRGLNKVPGWNGIEVNNKVHSFKAEGISLFQAEEINETLRAAIEVIEVIGHKLSR